VKIGGSFNGKGCALHGVLIIAKSRGNGAESFRSIGCAVG
jgi:hypothetical protein